MSVKVKALTEKLKLLLSHKLGSTKKPFLPPEILINVLGFLDQKELRKLCSVSRLFFYEFLNVKYTLLLLRSFRNGQNLKQIDQLRKADIANIVRGIHLTLFEDDFPTLLTKLSRILPTLPHFHSLHLDSLCSPSPSSTSSLLRSDGIRDKIRCLSITGPLESFSAFLDVELFMPSLTDLSLYISSSDDQRAIVPTFNLSVVPVIQRHAHQLVRLSLAIGLGLTDVSPLIHHITLPRLRTLEIDFRFRHTVARPSQLSAFLAKLDQLERLSLYLTILSLENHVVHPSDRKSMLDYMDKIHNGLVLANLTSLSIILAPPAVPSFVRYLKLYSTSLKELKLMSCFVLTCGELGQILEALESAPLKQLQVCIQTLDRYTLWLLAVATRLESLAVLFSEFSDVEEYPLDKFRQSALSYLGIGSRFGDKVLNQRALQTCRILFPDAIISTAQPDNGTRTSSGEGRVITGHCI